MRGSAPRLSLATAVTRNTLTLRSITPLARLTEVSRTLVTQHLFTVVGAMSVDRNLATDGALVRE